MKQRDIRTALLAVVVVAVGACASSGRVRAEPTGRTHVDVLAIGDSLLYEARAPLRNAMGRRTVAIHAVPGSALCDLARDLPTLLRQRRPRTVVVESVGNGITRCMRGVGAMGTRRFARRYSHDLGVIVGQVRRAGARTVVVDPPPLGALSAAKDSALTQLIRRWHTDFGGFGGVTFTGMPRAAVSDRGRFASALPCTGPEQLRSECRNGLIAIRDPYFGVHFCPATYKSAAAILRGCGVYSSGARRFGRAIARALSRR